MKKQTPIQRTNDGLGIFSGLSELGVKNIFTCDNKKWRNMSLLSNPRAIRKYERLFALTGIKHKEFIYIRPDHNDAIQVFTEENLLVYKLFNTVKKPYSNLKILPIYIDGVITKEKIPIIISPADCLVLVLTAKDRKDKKRFMILVHAGMSGAYLNIHKKALKEAKSLYSFHVSDVEAYVFPYISERNYKKPSTNNNLLPFLKSFEWKNFIKRKGKRISLAFGKKIESDLRRIGIIKIFSSGIDTYEAQKEGRLFSFVYQKKRRAKKFKHFAVVVSL